MVVRPWHGKAEGPGGNPVFLTPASGAKPLHPCDDEDDRRLLEHCGLTEATPPGDLPHPPPTTARAVRVQGWVTRRLVALATASRRPGERAALGGEPGGGPRGRRQLMEPNRDKVRVLAQEAYGIWPIAGCALLMGAHRKEVPPALGTRRDLFAKYGLPPKG